MFSSNKFRDFEWIDSNKWYDPTKLLYEKKFDSIGFSVGLGIELFGSSCFSNNYSNH